ncbi:MAG: fatty acid desaturase [Planctomycetota bacterium]|nr:MAG: fatty acid desaturase [Planctomycetota bacterium]
MAQVQEALLSVPEESQRAEILRHVEEIRDHLPLEEIKRAIPKECYESNWIRGAVGMLQSVLVLAACEAALLMGAPWWTWPVLWFLAGTAIWGLFVIGHECGHGSFSDHRKLNHFLGHLTTLPSLFPFHSWRLQHNHHHANTNRVDEDIDWCPIPRSVYQRMKPGQKRTFRLLRTWLWWYAVVRDWALRSWNPKNYRERDRHYVRFSMAVTAVFGVVAIASVIYIAGFLGFLKLWFMPWLVAFAWFALITMMHHTHPEVPYLDKKRWSKAASGLLLTVYCRYPRWLEFLMHDINVHIPHHVSSAIPYYHLRRAHQVLKDRWPEYIHETRFSFSYLFDILKRCHLYEHRSGGFYVPFAAAKR